ncbi:MAG: hypothetical protein DRN66_00750, partial [Candidatus Nanohalarchaeota archaeon]
KGNNATTANNTATIITSSAVSDGVYNWYINCSAGGFTNQSEIREITIDTIPPNITIYSPENTTYATTSVDLNYTATDLNNISWCGYSLDGNNNITLTDCNNITLTNLTEGQHNITVYTNDTAGNTNSTSIIFTVDTIDPYVEIHLPTTTIYNTTTLDLNYTSSDTNLNTTWYEYNSTNTTLTANTTFTALNNQQSTLILWANDTAGNVNSTSVTFTVDATEPYVEIFSPTNTTYDYDSNLPLNYTSTDEHLNTTWYSLNSGANITLTQNTTFNVSSDGQHYIDLYANDTLGNTNHTRIYFSIHTQWHTTLELNDTLSMRGKTICTNGIIVDTYGNNLTCANCLNITWGTTLHQDLNVTDGIYNDTYTIANSDNDMAITLNVSYSNKDGSNTTALTINPTYTVNVNCTNYLLNKNSSINCSAQIYDIDSVLMTSGIALDFKLNENNTFNYTDTIYPYLWSFNAPDIVGTYTIYANTSDSCNNTGQNNSLTFTVRELNLNLQKDIKVLNNKAQYESSDIIFANTNTGEFVSKITIPINVTDRQNHSQNNANLTIRLIAPNNSVIWTEQKQTSGGLYNHNFNLTGFVPNKSGQYTIAINATDNKSIRGTQNITFNVSFWKVEIWYNTSLSPFMLGEKVYFNITTYYSDTLTNVPDIEAQLRDDNSIPQRYRHYPQNITNYATGKYTGNFTTGDITLGDYFLYIKIINNSMTLAEDKHADITIGEDTESPQFSGNKTSPNAPTPYTGQNQFNITVSDNTGTIHTVILQLNTTNHTITTYRTINSTHYEYHTTLPLTPDTYAYRWYANDSSNNMSSTIQWNYTITKAPASINLYLNGTQNSTTYEKGDAINITATINITGKQIQLWTNFSGTHTNIQNATTALTNITDSSTLNTSTYNITALFTGDENYTSSYTTYFITISDTEGPSITDLNKIDLLEYNTQQNISATVTDIDGVSSVSIQRDSANYTMNPGYWYAWTPTQIPGSIISFIIFANDSNNNWNTLSSSFTITDTTPPTINSIDIIPLVSQLGSTIDVNASATDNYLIHVINATITKPSLNTTTLILNTTYTTEEDGNHSITVFANDTSGNVANSTSYFIVLNPANITLTPSAYTTTISIGASNTTNLTVNNTGGIDSTVNLYDNSPSWITYSNTTFGLENNSAVNITINITVPQGTTPDDYIYLITANSSSGTDITTLYFIVPDEQAPVIHNVSYCNITYGQTQSITVNATDNKQIHSYWINHNGTNCTMQDNSYTYTPQAIGIISFTIYVNDTAGNTNSSTGLFTVTDADAPTITSYSLSPKAVILNNNISISLSASDNYELNCTWANITLPDSSTTTVFLPANYNATQTGRHNITFFANDSSGNEANTTDYFISENAVAFNGSIINSSFASIESNITVYFLETDEIISSTNATGNFTFNIPDYIYDIRWTINSTSVQLNNVNLSQNSQKHVILDLPLPAGYLRACAVNTTYSFANATMILSYNNTAYTNENYLSVYRCSDWNFAAGACSSSWQGYANAYQGKSSMSFSVYVDSFSAYALKQDSYCGDGICDVSESCSSCPADCGSCGGGSSLEEMNITITGNCVNESIVFDTPPNAKINVYRGKTIIASHMFSAYADDKGTVSVILNETGFYTIWIIADGYITFETTIEVVECMEEEVVVYECFTSGDCYDTEVCRDRECIDVECKCGFVESHECIEYECCSDEECLPLECINHSCVDVVDEEEASVKGGEDQVHEESLDVPPGEEEKSSKWFVWILLSLIGFILLFFRKAK